MRYEIFDDIHSLSQRAALLVANAARQAASERGWFSIALSGGSTPAKLFQLLAQPEWCERVPWQSTHVFWADERCVPPDHLDSNYRMAHALLISRLVPPPAGVHRMEGEIEPHLAADHYEAALHAALGSPPVLDLVLLGMGADGHTASLFPGTEALREFGRSVVANFVPRLDAWRLTLTLPAINSARQAVFLVAGADKAEKVAEIAHLGDAVDGCGDVPPAALVKGAIWLLDSKAARAIVTK
ncbi:MAG: 6-phosphogluconolactonase [Armatimonadetes bacterium]|nr:6-phosphogluconolactonase [Armatimonadota bacterium]